MHFAEEQIIGNYIQLCFMLPCRFLSSVSLPCGAVGMHNLLFIQ